MEHTVQAVRRRAGAKAPYQGPSERDKVLNDHRAVTWTKEHRNSHPGSGGRQYMQPHAEGTGLSTQQSAASPATGPASPGFMSMNTGPSPPAPAPRHSQCQVQREKGPSGLSHFLPLLQQQGPVPSQRSTAIRWTGGAALSSLCILPSGLPPKGL